MPVKKRRIIFSIRLFNMAKWNYWSHHILIWLLMYPMKKDRASKRASGKWKGESMKQLHARTPHTQIHFNPSIFHGISHAQCSYIYGWVPLQWIIASFFLFFLYFRSLIEVALSRITCVSDSSHGLSFSLSFFGCGNCDLTKNRKYANHFSIVFINMCVSCLAHIQYIIEFV